MSQIDQRGFDAYSPHDVSGAENVLRLLDLAHDEFVAGVKRHFDHKPMIEARIPCRPFYDTDVLVSGALAAAKKEIQRLSRDLLDALYEVRA